MSFFKARRRRRKTRVEFPRERAFFALCFLKEALLQQMKLKIIFTLVIFVFKILVLVSLF